MENKPDKMIVETEYKLLTASELIENRNVKTKPKVVINKKNNLDGSEEEKKQLESLTNELLEQISGRRLGRLNERSVGEWDAKENAVKVVRKEGKFNAFGYSKNGNIYLEYFEAIFLLELNRLEIYYNSIMLSVEQAYLLLLGEERSIKYEKSYVYSMLSRYGYIVLSHRNAVAVTYECCIWEILRNSLDPNHEISEEIKTFEEFPSIAKNMEMTRNYFQKKNVPVDNDSDEKISESHTEESSTVKRKSDSSQDIQSKIPKITSNQHEKQSLINVLQNQPEYQKFKSIFDKFDLIQLSDNNVEDENDYDEMKIDFDLYFNCSRFKKSSPGLPCIRVALIRHDDQFPSHSKILKCAKILKSKLPIAVVCLTESKQLQGFLYHFT